MVQKLPPGPMRDRPDLPGPAKPPRKDTLFAQYLAPLARLILDDRPVRDLAERIDWEAARRTHENPQTVYPDYYLAENFHGIEGGYLTITAAATYDAITQYALPPHEDWVRDGLLRAVGGEPRRILDLGCGTGSMALALQRRFPNAAVVGLDLSPHMLAVAADKADRAGLVIDWVHAQAEATGFPAQRFDLISVALLFHETPPAIAKAILREAFRLLVPGGQIVILDGSQLVLRQFAALQHVFEEPYMDAYARGNLDVWLGAAGFEAVHSDLHWGIHQVSRAMKPYPVAEGLGDRAEGFGFARSLATPALG